MKSLRIPSFLLALAVASANAQYVVITSDTTVAAKKITLCKGEIYRGSADNLRGYFVILNEKDTIHCSRITPIGINKNNDCTPFKDSLIQITASRKYYIIDLAKHLKNAKETCYLYDSASAKKLTLLPGDYCRYIETKKLTHIFKVIIPNTPTLIYRKDDGFITYSLAPLGENFDTLFTVDKKTIAWNPDDKSTAFLIDRKIPILKKIDTSVNNKFVISKKKTFEFNKATNQWKIIKKTPTGLYLLAAFLLLCSLAALVWFFILKRIPVYTMYSFGDFTQFAEDYVTTKNFLFKSNSEFKGKNLNDDQEKSRIKEEISGHFLIVGYKYRLAFGKKFPVYIRFNTKIDNLDDLSQAVKVKPATLQYLNKGLSKALDIKVPERYDIYIGNTYKNKYPKTLDDLIKFNENPETFREGEIQSSPVVTETKPQKIAPVDTFRTPTQKSSYELLTEFSNAVKDDLSRLGNKIVSLDQIVHQLDDTVNQRNKAKQDVRLGFYSSESVNALHCINRYQTIERELFESINALKLSDPVKGSFVFGCANRYLYSQMPVKERLGFWKLFLDACRNNRSLSTDDVVFKQISEEILQFAGDEERSVFISRKLFSDLWENYFSNMLLLCEELRNTSLFLNQTSIKDNACSMIEGYGDKYAQMLMETAKSLNLTMLYVPLFASYENSNLKNLDIESFISFDYFYDQMKERLSKNSVVQVVSYGIIASKIDRSTKTKIKILS